MSGARSQSTTLTAVQDALAEALRAGVAGEVRFDALSRTIYATDASMYEIIPAGVVLPRHTDDVVAVMEACRGAGVSVVPRGAGTGLAGGTVGPGVQLDLSRHMNAIGPPDLKKHTIDVGPGVVLDELNRDLAPLGLHFAPDVATGNRATIGGMIANNSCGARSIVYGRTVDHVVRLKVVLADGAAVTFGTDATDNGPGAPAGGQRVDQIGRGLADIRDRYADEIKERFPRILRSNAGYGLDRLGPPGHRVDPIGVLCGSEGTLGVIVGATLKLTPVPKHTGLVVLPFPDVLEALDATTVALRHGASAVELIDRMILDAGRSFPALRARCGFIQGDPHALLAVEFLGEEDGEVAAKMDALLSDADVAASAARAARLTDAQGQADVWAMRKAGLGLLMSRPGEAQPQAFVEDTAVDPRRLREYIERFSAIIDSEGVEASYYAHASAGCLHVRPVINLRQAGDIDRMRIAEAVCELAVTFGGTTTAEHGDGIVRSCWLERLYGSKITSAFGEVKRLFDPTGLMNPNKIVDPLPMTEQLRYGPSFVAKPVKTFLDFSAYGGMAGLAGMCSGVGQCRQRLVDSMCPSYHATGDEQHTTRARANALRVALSNRGLLDGLDDPNLKDVMDLCISCKACKAECPTGVDMARLKAETLARRHLVQGVPKRARLVADMPRRLALPSHFPGLSNWVGQSKVMRGLMERWYGIDRRVPPPRFARRTFRAWYRRHRKEPRSRPTRGPIVYFVDTWANFFTPQVGIAAVRLLERAGFDVLCPHTRCCGRPAISQGLLADAKQMAEFNAHKLARFAAGGIPIVGTEPSCVLTLTDEYPQLVRTAAARRVAEHTSMLESFLLRLLTDDPVALRFTEGKMSVLYHAHCHQKALVGSGDAVALLRDVLGNASSEIPSGCCGMAGAFGHEVEHYEVSKAIGEDRLFPAVRSRGDAQIAVSGFSCRQQIVHHTGAPARHLIEYLADALA